MENKVRLSKRMSELGICSRREADSFIEKGWVKVNGIVINQLGYKISQNETIELTTQAKAQLDQLITIIMNKPVGFVSSQPEEKYQAASELLKRSTYKGKGQAPKLSRRDLQTLAPAGRLDIDSTGLLVLTQDGKVAKTIISPHSNIEKEYIVKVEGEITSDKIKKLRFGLKLDGKPLKPAKIFEAGAQRLRIVLTEGKKRQIRRMCELVELKVLTLKRVRIGNIKLGSLKQGEWRMLSANEKI